MAYSGTIFRIHCNEKCFRPNTPYDQYCDESKTGTGFLLRLPNMPKPWIVTAHHVVSNAARITATSPSLPNGEWHSLQIVGYNPYLDVAILTLEDMRSDMTPFECGLSSTLKPEDRIVCIGFAGGTRRTHLTSGTVSARNSFPHNRIQTDAAVNPGNSGGPVVNVTTKRVVGIVTSGEDGMQNTNFFTPMEEAYNSVMRMLTQTQQGAAGIDLGYHLNAVVRPVDSVACNGHPGGALVAAVEPECGLHVNDVIVGVTNGAGEMLTLDVHMRVTDPLIWDYDAVDFRSILDALPLRNPSETWVLNVRRDGVTRPTSIRIGPSTRASRELFPDCEPVFYCTFAGVVVQMLSTSHGRYVQNAPLQMISNPDVDMYSVPIITNVVAGCPYAVHGAMALEGTRVCRIQGADGQWYPIETLSDIQHVLDTTQPTVLELHTNYRVGATVEAIVEYETEQTTPYLVRGTFRSRRGMNLSHYTEAVSHLKDVSNPVMRGSRGATQRTPS